MTSGWDSGSDGEAGGYLCARWEEQPTGILLAGSNAVYISQCLQLLDGTRGGHIDTLGGGVA